MVGDADLNIERDSNSTPWIEDLIYEAATRLGYQSHFFVRTMAVSDDHLPLVKRGVPCADLIDFNYGYDDVFWHTTQDTVDKLSPKSLEIVGTTVLELSLSVDNLVLFLVIFRYFSVPEQHQRSVLFWGILGALLMRGIFILAGVGLIQRFHWIPYVLGALLIYSGIRLGLSGEHQIDPATNPAVKA